jgi:flagellar hook-associated protein 1 FlgK
MTISQGLSNAASGLAAAARMAGVSSNNVANALTPGYVRRDLLLAERSLAGTGAGVRVAGVLRAAVPAVTAERRAADADLARNRTLAGAAEKLSRMLGAGPEDRGSIVSRFTAFESALRANADDPQNLAAGGRAISAARDVVGRLNALARQAQDVRTEADAAIAAGVERVNADLAEIERINKAIVQGASSGADVSALEDERQRRIDSINGFIPVRALNRGGAVDIITSEGVFLLAGRAFALSFSPSPSISGALTLDNGALSRLTVADVDITPGGGGPVAPTTGEAAGLFAVRDSVGPDAATALDAFAADIIARFSATGIDPTLPAGSAGLFTDAGGSLSGVDGVATRISVNATVDPTQGGATWRLRDGLGASAPGAAGSDEQLRRLIDALASPVIGADGRARSAAEAAVFLVSRASAIEAETVGQAAISDALQAGLAEAEGQAIRVDTDHELKRMLIVEQAYAANARVIEIIDRIIQNLLEI